MTEERPPRRLWDDIIPETVILPGRVPRKEPEVPDLVFKRVPGKKYALYVAHLDLHKEPTP